MGKTNIEFIMEIDSIITNSDINSEENELNQTVYKCCCCSWRFVGDCIRYNHEHDSESVQMPNYCPMCGREIEKLIE